MASGDAEEPRDIRVRVALLEQALVHHEQLSDMHRETDAARSAGLERQIGSISEQLLWLYSKSQHQESIDRDLRLELAQTAESLNTVKAKQESHDKLAVRLRYSGAAALMLLVAGDRLSPEVLAKMAKVAGLVAF